MSAPMSDEDEFWQAHYAAASLGPTLKVRLHLPYEAPPKPLNANWRGHWSARARATAQVRADVTALAKQAGLHRLGNVEHVTVQLVWAPGDNRRRDSDNLYPLFKVGCDALARGRAGLVGLDLVPDDDPVHMTKCAPVILPSPASKGMWLDLWVRLPRLDPADA